MKKFKPLLWTLTLSLPLSLALSGCGAGVGYYMNARTWIGAPVKELIAVWGRPTAVRDDAGGEKVYTFAVSQSAKIPQKKYTPPDRLFYEAGPAGEQTYSMDRAKYDTTYDSAAKGRAEIACQSEVRVGPDGVIQAINHNSLVGEGFFSISDCITVDAPPARPSEE